MFRRFIGLLALLSLTGCAWGPKTWPGAQPGDFENNAVIGVYHYYMDSAERFADRSAIAVDSINGERLSGVIYVLAPPGKYKAAIGMIGPAHADNPGGATRWSGEFEFEAKAGHTYRPDRVKNGDRAKLYIEDLGTDFPIECLPFVVNPDLLELPPTCTQP